MPMVYVRCWLPFLQVPWHLRTHRESLRQHYSRVSRGFISPQRLCQSDERKKIPRTLNRLVCDCWPTFWLRVRPRIRMQHQYNLTKCDKWKSLSSVTISVATSLFTLLV
ncbi:hypothetical protein RB213_012246 [Colletotrichum asianum]